MPCGICSHKSHENNKLQSPASQAHNHGLNEIFGFGFDFDKKYMEMIESVTREDIIETVEKFIKNPVTVITSP
jgi:predicted Zn-dependent peptidase